MNQNQEEQKEGQKLNQPAEEPAVSDLKEELEKAKQKQEEYLAGWQRAKADFLNYKKDEFKRFEEVIRFGNENLLRDLIAVLDSFELGLAALEKSGPVEKGIYMVKAQIEDVLKKYGLEKIEVKPSQVFDPGFAEAVSEIESDLPAGTIVEEVETGYRLYGKIFRPARVKISKGQQNK